MLRDLNASKVSRVAVREYVSTALTKGFIIGAFVVPALLIPIVAAIALLIGNAEPPAERGVIAVVDPTGVVVGPFTERIDPEAIAERRGQTAREAIETIDRVTGGLGGEQAAAAAEQAVVANVPNLTVELIEPGDDDESADQLIEFQQERLRLEADREDPTKLVAIAVIDANAIVASTPDATAEDAEGEDAELGEPTFGSYELFVRPKLDTRTTGEIRDSLSTVIREQRFIAAGEDLARYQALARVSAPSTQEVTDTGTRDATFGVNEILPFAVMFLVFMGVMTGGQYLLTTTVEEKSSRVIEVLLSAASPIELMLGKILGQLGVGLTILVAYNAVGLIALFALGLFDIIEPLTLVYMLIFFLLAYFIFGAFMGAVGAAVNELREAQSLLTPVVMILIVSFYLAMPVALDPDATYAVVLSLIPPVSPFVMLTRVTSNVPPPFWQVALAIGINTIAAMVSVWLAAKIFRVGLLQFGKAPNLMTMLRWIRMA